MSRIGRIFFPQGGNVRDYLGTDLLNTIRELKLALARGLNFDDNFKSFSVTVDIDAAGEVLIQNQLRTIPNEWVVVDAVDGGPLVRGTKEWTLSDIWIANLGDAGTFKIRFFATGDR